MTQIELLPCEYPPPPDRLAPIEARGVVRPSLPFRPGDMVEHRKGGHYRVEGIGTIEATMQEVYAYRGHDGRLWLRPIAEMEDGRFKKIGHEPDRARESAPAVEFPHLDIVAKQLQHEDPKFSEWVRAMPDKYWAKYDLSAVKLGYELGRIVFGEKK